MDGINAKTGARLVGIDHLRQSVRDILTTPIGSRVMRRDYGSRLFELVDRPYSANTRLAFIAATVEALLAWEPRIAIDQVALRSFEPGLVTLDLTGRYLPEGRPITLEGLQIS